MMQFSLLVLLASACYIDAHTDEQLEQLIETAPCCGPHSTPSFWTCANPATCRWTTQEPCKPTVKPGCICWPGYVLNHLGHCVHPADCPDDPEGMGSGGKTPQDQQAQMEDQFKEFWGNHRQNQNGQMGPDSFYQNQDQFSAYQNSGMHPEMGPDGALRSRGGIFGALGLGWLLGGDDKKEEKKQEAAPPSPPVSPKLNHWEIRPFQSQQIAIQA